MAVYYNEIDPFAAAWLRELMAEGVIAAGEVDERSIEEVQPQDLAGFAQCHFFAGIGGWSLALRTAGWPDDSPVWTGSCPCQSFSASGKRTGFGDQRHLWPAWFRLIRECGPDTIFGEQVASNDGLAWLDVVSADLEGAGYAVGAADLCAAGVGAPHIRQRLYFVAHAELRAAERFGFDMGETARGFEGATHERQRLRLDAGDGGNAGGANITRGFWADAEWLPCRDGKLRPTQSGIFPLAHGFPNRVGTLRGAGNAIVPQVAAAFIEAWRESKGIVSGERAEYDLRGMSDGEAG